MTIFTQPDFWIQVLANIIGGLIGIGILLLVTKIYESIKHKKVLILKI